MRNNIFVFVVIVGAFSLRSKALEIPENLKSENAAVILGLDQEKSITKGSINRSYRKLFMKYHPDFFQDKTKYTDQDRKDLTEIASKLNSARETLLEFIRVNPSFNPSSNSGEAGETFSKNASNQKPGSSWEDVFGNHFTPRGQGGNSNYGFSDGRSVVHENYFGDSLRGTMFEFLYQYPNFKTAVLPLIGQSVRINQEDGLMVIHADRFPMIEIRLVSKKRSDQFPIIGRSIWGKYTRGHHLGNSGNNLVDSIVLQDGTYFMPWFVKGYPNALSAKRFGGSDASLLITSTRGIVFQLLGADGYSRGAGLDLVFEVQTSEPELFLPKNAHDIAPEVKEPIKLNTDWKHVQIPIADQVIYLGYTMPPARTCKEVLKKVSSKNKKSVQ